MAMPKRRLAVLGDSRMRRVIHNVRQRVARPKRSQNEKAGHQHLGALVPQRDAGHGPQAGARVRVGRRVTAVDPDLDRVGRAAVGVSGHGDRGHAGLVIFSGNDNDDAVGDVDLEGGRILKRHVRGQAAAVTVVVDVVRDPEPEMRLAGVRHRPQGQRGLERPRARRVVFLAHENAAGQYAVVVQRRCPGAVKAHAGVVDVNENSRVDVPPRVAVLHRRVREFRQARIHGVDDERPEGGVGAAVAQIIDRANAPVEGIARKAGQRVRRLRAVDRVGEYRARERGGSRNFDGVGIHAHAVRYGAPRRHHAADVRLVVGHGRAQLNLVDDRVGNKSARRRKDPSIAQIVQSPDAPIVRIVIEPRGRVVRPRALHGVGEGERRKRRGLRDLHCVGIHAHAVRGRRPAHHHVVGRRLVAVRRLAQDRLVHDRVGHESPRVGIRAAVAQIVHRPHPPKVRVVVQPRHGVARLAAVDCVGEGDRRERGRFRHLHRVRIHADAVDHRRPAHENVDRRCLVAGRRLRQRRLVYDRVRHKPSRRRIRAAVRQIIHRPHPPVVRVVVQPRHRVARLRAFDRVGEGH